MIGHYSKKKSGTIRKIFDGGSDNDVAHDEGDDGDSQSRQTPLEAAIIHHVM